MPLWNRRRLALQTANELRPRSVLDPTSPGSALRNESPSVEDGQQLSSPSAPQRPFKRNRDSVVSLGATRTSSFLDARPLSSGPSKIADAPSRRNRFSLLKFRHASDPQLSKTAKEHAEAMPMPMLARDLENGSQRGNGSVHAATTPSIITTAPTLDNLEDGKRRTANTLPRGQQRPQKSRVPSGSVNGTQRPSSSEQKGLSQAADDGSPPQQDAAIPSAPPAYGDESNSALALPISRASESSRSDGSSNDQRVYATTTTTTHTVSTTTFFRIPRRKRNKGPLFPLPPKVRSDASTSGLTPPISSPRPSADSQSNRGYLPLTGERGQGGSERSGQPSPARPRFGPSSSLARSTSRDSFRGSSTALTSIRRGLENDNLPTPTLPPSTRTSISTTGRPSLGGLFQFNRTRQPSEPILPRTSGSGVPGTPASVDSRYPLKSPRETPVVVPARQDGDTPARYLARLEEVVNRNALVSLLSKSDDEFTKNVLRSYMRRFRFFEDPLDIAVRKMLMHVELPKETQQIDRTLQSFADRYHECNPGIFVSSDDAYFVAFSILILHTDFFNKNNKHKMQRAEYVKNSREQSGIAPEILEYFYDNIAYTPFIHVEDDMQMASDKHVTQESPRKWPSKPPGAPSLKKGNTGPIDPYTLIFESKLDLLRPSLIELFTLEDPFSFSGPSGTMDVGDIHRSFFRSGVIQILSTRSRPDAFLNQATITNPAGAQIGVVDLKISKVGLLWRKDLKKKKTRSPWQEWGAVLTSSQLYMFRNTAWVKSLIHQYESHAKTGRCDTAVIFKPPLEHFKPDFLIPTDDVVALADSSYKKHKNAFVLTRRNVFQEVLLADNEGDLNDWLAKLNYASTFRTAGVRMKGMPDSVQGTSKDQDQDTFRPEANENTRESLSRTGPESSLTKQVRQARRQIMMQRMQDAESKIALSDKQLDEQLRTVRHLSILAPIQPKTRIDVVSAAEGLAAQIRWTRVEKWRMKCHREIMNMDLEDDAMPTLKRDVIVDLPPKKEAGWQSKSPFSRFNSKSSSGAGGVGSRSRPTTQPTGNKLFSMDEIFRSPSKPRPQVHKPKGSWEIPPLNFDDLRRSNSLPRDGADPSLHNTDVSEASAPSVEEAGSRNAPSEHDDTAPSRSIDQGERGLLVEADLLGSEFPTPLPVATDASRDVESEEESEKIHATEDKEGLTKVRHNLQRKLQNAHVPSHHRSRRSKEPGESRRASEDGSSKTSQGLPRNQDKFTVHGKKASVIKFGSEWQSISQDDRVKARKSARPNSSQSQETDATAGAAAVNEQTRSSSITSSNSNARDSARRSTSTAHSVDFQTPLESTPPLTLGEPPPLV